ncbi:hypothetical protein [Inhella inkyongensis]|uniref:hypothetical protein n=1 Tax=Inhella inkyongensis TaxID=392593 RepID=UPI001610283F|nr:hypothetical protein [Inhella inkyongensis]
MLAASRLQRLGQRAAAALWCGVLAWLPAPGAAHPEPAPEWRWMLADYAPTAMRRGPDAGRGFAQRMLDEVLVPGLTGFRHQKVWVPSQRMDMELAAANGSCGLLWRKTAERSAQWLVSRPLIRLLPVGLVVRRSELERWRPFLNEAGELSLTRVLAAERVLGVTPRAHGPVVDGLLERHPNALRRIQLLDATRVVLTMLARGHGTDAALAYGFEVAYFNRQQQDGRAEPLATLQWLPLAEKTDLLYSHAVCSRGEVGRQQIQALEALLERPGVRERLQALYEEWLSEPERRRLHQARQQLGARFWQE